MAQTASYDAIILGAGQAGGVEEECATAVAQSAGAVVVGAISDDQAGVAEAAGAIQRPLGAFAWIVGI